MMYSKLTDKETEVLFNISRALQVNPDWLYQLIDFESRWDPLAKNPYSGARGLIQFVNSTAQKTLGFFNADDLVSRYPDRISQMQGPVYNYLSFYAPFPTQQSLAMAVYYPAYRNVPGDQAFPADTVKNNPGIFTPNDYIKKVFGTNVLLPVAIIGGIAAIFLIIYSFSQKG